MGWDLSAAKEAEKWMRERGVLRLALRAPDGSELSIELDQDPLAALGVSPLAEPDQAIAPAPPPDPMKCVLCQARVGRHAPRCDVCWRQHILSGGDGAN
jgi:hypothetical protein